MGGLYIVYNDPVLVKRSSWKQLPFSWPPEIYSLSHVALPFSSDDPIYGDFPVGQEDHLRLGNIHVRGEKNIFVIPEKNLMRLRHNPFYALLENRILQFLGVTDKS